MDNYTGVWVEEGRNTNSDRKNGYGLPPRIMLLSANQTMRILQTTLTQQTNYKLLYNVILSSRMFCTETKQKCITVLVQ